MHIFMDPMIHNALSSSKSFLFPFSLWWWNFLFYFQIKYYFFSKIGHSLIILHIVFGLIVRFTQHHKGEPYVWRTKSTGEICKLESEAGVLLLKCSLFIESLTALSAEECTAFFVMDFYGLSLQKLRFHLQQQTVVEFGY